MMTGSGYGPLGKQQSKISGQEKWMESSTSDEERILTQFKITKHKVFIHEKGMEISEQHQSVKTQKIIKKHIIMRQIENLCHQLGLSVKKLLSPLWFVACICWEAKPPNVGSSSFWGSQKSGKDSFWWFWFKVSYKAGVNLSSTTTVNFKWVEECTC